MFSFENLEVYKKAFQLNSEVYQFIKSQNTIPPYFKNQLGRAALSIMLNIAEGSAKFNDRERKNFWSISRASIFECASIIHFLHTENEISEPLRAKLLAEFEQLSKMLFVMIRNLIDKDLKSSLK